MLKRILLACALVASLAFLPSSAVADDTVGGDCNGYWRHPDYDPSGFAGSAVARFEWHCNHFEDGDLYLDGFIETGALDPGWCVQMVVDAPWEGEQSQGHSDAQILRNCDPNTRVNWPGGLERVDTSTVNGTERVFRIQVALWNKDWSPDTKLTYFPRCRYFPGWELRPTACDDWDPWGPANKSNTRWTRQRDGDIFYNDGGYYWGANQ